MYELIPTDINQKSYYKKAIVRRENGRIILKSYSTDVCYLDMKNYVVVKPVVYGTHSNTTLKHIKSFLRQYGFKAETKKQILNDYGEC
jgi:hypothetical protein